ncbi:unnamed protein product [Lactuca saligna]|uniref:PPPDE domain-containing protein n=1 Tax=Lactuca saligna TaxID=75948 RepID=A0AA35YHI8_LACSI|nr:unnamed protein product [Lactuca saligna]
MLDLQNQLVESENIKKYWRMSMFMEKTNGHLGSVSKELEFLVALLERTQFNQILRELSREWPGNCYDLLSKNCNHFCNEFCERLGVPKLPGWVNRFANAGDTAVEIAETTAVRFRQAKTEIVTASKVAYRFLAGITSNNNNSNNNIGLDSPGNRNNNSPRFQQPSWFKNLVAAGAKPSTSTTTTLENEKPQLLQKQESQV